MLKYRLLLIAIILGIEAGGYAMTIKLPEPRYDSDISIEETLKNRRSVRNYSNRPLTLQEVSQLLWASQGITKENFYRTAPSAGALYPLEVYVVCGNVKDLSAGIYKYRSHKHELLRILEGDKRRELCNAALGQSCVKNAPIDIVFSGVFERTTGKYGQRGIRYVYMEAGHAAENLLLQAVSLNLGAVVIGAFSDRKVKKVMEMRGKEEPLYIIPVGRE